MEGYFDLKEKIKHGELDFPLGVYYDIELNSKYKLFYHWHSEVEFLYLKNGSMVFDLDTESIEINEGEAIFINSGIVHSANLDFDKKCSFNAIVFSLNMLVNKNIGKSLNEILLPVINKKSLIPIKYTKDSKWGKNTLDEIKKIMKVYKEANFGFEFSIMASLYSIIYTLSQFNVIKLNNIKNSRYEEIKLEQFKKSLMFISKNYNRKLDLDKLAKVVNMSKYHFCRFFKSMSGKTPFEYLIEYRIYMAEKLLNGTDRKVLDIALEVGFENIGYFNRRFKESKKCTPSEFRKNSFKGLSEK